MLRHAWDKLGEYLGLYTLITLASLVLRWVILKWRRK